MITVCNVKICMKYVELHKFRTGRHKRQADITLLFQYIVACVVRKYNHCPLQTNPRHCEEEPYNIDRLRHQGDKLSKATSS